MMRARLIARRVCVVVTCEHAGNRVPAEFRPLFRGSGALLATHRGYDPGALTVARELAGALDAPLFAATVSRLVVDLNRSIGHPRLFGEITRILPAAARRRILDRHYLSYRKAVEECIAGAVAGGMRVIHISSHSFTPELEGEVRNADIGLLYDPARAGERDLCARWRSELIAALPGLRVRRNYPYRGTSDGLTAHLRKHFPAERYSGIELEINQRYPLGPQAEWRRLRAAVVRSLREALAE